MNTIDDFCLFSDSVKALLGKQVKILFKNVVRLETKGDKTENRVLVSSLLVYHTFKFICFKINAPLSLSRPIARDSESEVVTESPMDKVMSFLLLFGCLY